MQERTSVLVYRPRPRQQHGPGFQGDLDPSARPPAPGREERKQAGRFYPGEPACLGSRPGSALTSWVTMDQCLIHASFFLSVK